MNIEAISLANPGQFQSSKSSDKISDAREKAVDLVQSDAVEKQQVQPEELLQQIKALTENGLYSVRFETDERTDEMVVKVVDHESGEVIRQIPSEELLNTQSALQDLRGNIVDTEG